VKVWIASAKLTAPLWLGILILFPVFGLFFSVLRVVGGELLGESMGWFTAITYIVGATYVMLELGLVLGAATFNIVVPWTRYEIWKNNQVLSRKERDEIERQKGEI
jgi:hypothetical protein